jgi:hypothetical protein
MRNNNMILLKNRAPIICLKSGVRNMSGSPASRVPAGQMYLQNHEEPYPDSSMSKAGNKKTKSMRNTYGPKRKGRGRLSFALGMR